jgi:hypothetical protein
MKEKPGKEMTPEQRQVLVEAMTVLRQLSHEHPDPPNRRKYMRQLAELLEILVSDWHRR